MGETIGLIGSGGREFEMGRTFAKSKEVEEILWLPGNAGDHYLPKVTSVKLDKDASIPDYFADNGVSYIAIGPEQPSADGLADELRERGFTVFGPGVDGAQLEASKSHAEAFMNRHGVPHPRSKVAESIASAITTIDDPTRWVIKADGLAAGKGVILPKSLGEAVDAIYEMFEGDQFGYAGREKIILQERVNGPEVSAFGFFDGVNSYLVPIFSQDHKRLLEGDQGPNTGGMGAYAPVPESIVSAEQRLKIEEIHRKTVEGLKAEKIDYRGVIYYGLMLAEEYHDDPVVIEYNVRFGDPEAQVVLPLMEYAGVDNYELFRSVAEQRLDPDSINIPSDIGRVALTRCLASGGYPGTEMSKGHVIHGLDQEYEDVIIHHGGTSMGEEGIINSGGRVGYITGIGRDFDEAAAKSYAADVSFKDMQQRLDIGHQVRTR